MPRRFNKAERDEFLSRTAAPIFPNTHNQVAPQAPPQQAEQSPWGAVQACPQCGHGMHTYEGQHGAMCPNCGHEEAVMAQPRTADASMPPEGVPYQQKETALPYNPEAYESQVNDMHPAAQYTYQRAVAQGSDPQAAYAAAQEKQGEMGKRTQEGQNTQGIQIPVINTSYHGAANPDPDACNLCNGTGQDENSNDDCPRCDGSGQEPKQEREKQPRKSYVIPDSPGFVSAATISRVSHLVK